MNFSKSTIAALAICGSVQAGSLRGLTTIDPTPVVTGFSLVDANKNEKIQPIKDGEVISTAIEELNVVAHTSGMFDIDHVKFARNGNKNFRTEFSPDYSLCGDISNDYKPCDYTCGDPWIITATPYYTNAEHVVVPGIPLSLTFTIACPDNTFPGVERYKADLGTFGEFMLEVRDDGTMSWLSDLTNIKELENNPDVGGEKPITNLNYHLHTQWNLDESYGVGGVACGPANLGGHYDPNFACGPATAVPEDQCITLNRFPKAGTAYSCSGAYDVDPHPDFGQCEVGDLSGKFGAVNIDNDGNGFHQVQSDPLSERTLRA